MQFDLPTVLLVDYPHLAVYHDEQSHLMEYPHAASAAVLTVDPNRLFESMSRGETAVDHPAVEVGNSHSKRTAAPRGPKQKEW